MKNKILATLLSFTLIFTTTGFSFADGDEATPAPEPEKKSEQVVEKKAEAPAVEKKEVKEVVVKEEALKVEATPEKDAVKQEEPKELESVDKVKEVANSPPAKLDEKANMKEEKKPPQFNFTVTGWEGYYDGNAHWVTIDPTKPGHGMKYKYKVAGVQNGWSENIPALVNVGEYYVQVKVFGPESIGNVEGGAWVIIKKKEIVITVNDAEKVYNAADPEFTAEVTPADAPKVKYDLVRKPGENVGKYTITAKVYGNNLPSHYTVVVKDGTLTINPVVLEVNDAKKVYGTKDPEFTATHNSTVKFQYSLYREPGEDVGDYAIKARVPDEKNYVVKEGTLTITPATLKIHDAEKLYGADDPKFTADWDGPAKIQWTYSREPGEDVGEYVITAKIKGSNEFEPVAVDVKENVAVKKKADKKDNIVVETGLLRIYPRTVWVDIDDFSKVYGDKDPNFGTAKVISDDSDGFKVPYPNLKYAVGRVVEGEDVDTYGNALTLVDYTGAEIDVQTLNEQNPNYVFKINMGDFKITPREITIAAVYKFKMLKDVTDDEEFDATVTGVLPQDEEWFEDNVYWDVDCDYEEAVGDYPIIVEVELWDDEDEWIIIDWEDYAWEDYPQEMKKVEDVPMMAAKSVGFKKNTALEAGNYTIKTVDNVFQIRDKEEPVDPDDPDDPDNPVVGPTDNGDNTPGLGDGGSTVMKAKSSAVQTGDADACWALLNLLLMITSCLLAFLVVLSRVLRKDEEYVDEPKPFFNNWFESIMSGAVAVFTAIVFFITENMNTPMVWTDRWTVMMIVLFVLQLGVVAYVKFRDKIFEEDN